MKQKEKKVIGVEKISVQIDQFEGMATYSSFLAWRTPMDRGAWWATVCMVIKVWTLLK